MSKEITILSGIKPTGQLTLGNYLGAIKFIVNLQHEYPDAKFYIFIADLHATTIPITPAELRANSKSIAAFYIACGIDPKRVNIFRQSDVLEHANLGFLMESTAYIGEMERMIQFKEKSIKQKQTGIKTSLLTYPALMAADILLYDATYVPIGDDQKQHLELTQLLAERYNKLYGNTFIVPKALFNPNATRIKSLQDPSKKMSKSSDNPKSYILMQDSAEQITKKIKSAVTDSDGLIKYDPENKPGLANLINIFAAIKNTTTEQIINTYKDKTYKDIKLDLADALVAELSPIQAKYQELINSDKLEKILVNGASEARKIASKVLLRAKENIGLL